MIQATFEDLMFVRHQLDMEITSQQTELDMNEFLDSELLVELDAEQQAWHQKRLADLEKARDIVEGWLAQYLKLPKGD